MKIFISTLFFLMSLNSSANIEQLRVSEFFCGEIDPHVLGDSCILTGTSKTKKYGVRMDFDLYSKFEGKILAGDIILLDTESLFTLVFDELSYGHREVYWEYFGGFEKNLFDASFEGAIVGVKSNEILSSYKLKCVNNDLMANEFLYGMISIEAKLNVFKFDAFSLSDIKLKYLLSTDEDQESIWSEGNFYDKGYTLMNMNNYRPRVYLNHIKFPGVYSYKGFGEIDLILPLKSFAGNTHDSEFSSVVIMTSIDDHAGDTIGVNCSIKRL